MKRLLFVLMVLVFTVVNTPVFASNSTVVNEVGLKLLAEKEAILTSKIKEIDQFVLQISADGVVRRTETIKLSKLVKDFRKTKKKVNKPLKFYGLNTKTDLNKNLEIALFDGKSRYGFFHHVVIMRDSHDLLKRYLVTKSGKDVNINSFLAFSTIFFVLMIFVFLFLLIGIALVDKLLLVDKAGAIGSFFIVMALVILIMAFAA